jgi:hypothetical protein
MLSSSLAPLAETWNGAASYGASGEALTDLFYQTARGLDRTRLRALLDQAWRSDHLLTMRLIAYVRQVRGGKGERDLGRWSLDWLAEHSPRDLLHNLRHYVDTFGRWDDLICLTTHPSVREGVFALVAKQLRADADALGCGERSISLAAKWVPSESKKESEANMFNRLLAQHMELSRKELRQLLTRLRKALDLLETHLAKRTLEQVNYSKIPSLAMNRHGKQGKAFERRDGDRFAAYKAALTKDEAKVNTSALFPHQVVEKYLEHGRVTGGPDELTEAQWRSVLERLTPEERGHLGETLTVVDTSGSMYHGGYGGKTTTMPITVALTLGLLVTEVNPNPAFKDLVLTFHEHPEFHRITGTSLHERAASLAGSSWGGSTNFEATFGLILSKALEYKLSPADMPKTLLVISDMQFNSAGHMTNYQALVKAYEEAGYKVPRLVFWNVNGSTTNFPVAASQADTAMVSGFSIEILRDVLKGEEITPFKVIMRTLDRDDYQVITLAPPPAAVASVETTFAAVVETALDPSSTREAGTGQEGDDLPEPKRTKGEDPLVLKLVS